MQYASGTVQRWMVEMVDWLLSEQLKNNDGTKDRGTKDKSGQKRLMDGCQHSWMGKQD